MSAASIETIKKKGERRRDREVRRTIKDTLHPKGERQSVSIEAMKKKSERRLDREVRRKVKDTLHPKGQRQTVIRQDEFGRFEHVVIYRKTPRYYLNVVLSALKLSK